MNVALKKKLVPIVKSYHIDDIMAALQEVAAERADELIDLHQGSSLEETKALTRAFWHLNLLVKDKV